MKLSDINEAQELSKQLQQIKDFVANVKFGASGHVGMAEKYARQDDDTTIYVKLPHDIVMEAVATAKERVIARLNKLGVEVPT